MDNSDRPPAGSGGGRRGPHSPQDTLGGVVRGAAGVRIESPPGGAPRRRPQRPALEHQEVPAQPAQGLQLQGGPQERDAVVDQRLEPHRLEEARAGARGGPGK